MDKPLRGWGRGKVKYPIEGLRELSIDPQGQILNPEVPAVLDTSSDSPKVPAVATVEVSNVPQTSEEVNVTPKASESFEKAEEELLEIPERPEGYVSVDHWRNIHKIMLKNRPNYKEEDDNPELEVSSDALEKDCAVEKPKRKKKKKRAPKTPSTTTSEDDSLAERVGAIAFNDYIYCCPYFKTNGHFFCDRSEFYLHLPACRDEYIQDREEWDCPIEVVVCRFNPNHHRKISVIEEHEKKCLKKYLRAKKRKEKQARRMQRKDSSSSS